jgi:hypothetical protein
MSRNRYNRLLALVLVAVAGCTGEEAEPTAAKRTTEPTSPAIQDVMEVADIGSFALLEPGTYFMDPDLDPATSPRVAYEVAAEGWSQWLGAVKFEGNKHVAMSVTTVSNLVRHGCRNHSRADPPVGPTVDDLADALSKLKPFRVTAPPTDITIYGYRGKHLELTVPKIDLATCVGGKLKSWVDPLSEPHKGDAYYGYTGPGYVEEFWILDVDGSRLMIAAERSPASPAEDLTELRAVLDSIRIEP